MTNGVENITFMLTEGVLNLSGTEIIKLDQLRKRDPIFPL